MMKPDKQRCPSLFLASWEKNPFLHSSLSNLEIQAHKHSTLKKKKKLHVLGMLFVVRVFATTRLEEKGHGLRVRLYLALRYHLMHIS